MRPAAVLFLADLLLACLAAEANHSLSGCHVALYVGGLLVAGNALLLPLGPGLVASLAIGACCDAQAPFGWFGRQALLFAAAHALLHALRDRLPRDLAAAKAAAALLANLAIFFALSALAMRLYPAPGSAWLRLGSDLLVSQLAVAAVAPWFFALQARALELARAVPDRAY